MQEQLKKFTEAVTIALQTMAEDNARTLATQITATVLAAQGKGGKNAVTWYRRADVPDDLLALCELPQFVTWVAIVDAAGDPELVTQWALLREEPHNQRQFVSLPNGEVVVYGED